MGKVLHSVQVECAPIAMRVHVPLQILLTELHWSASQVGTISTTTDLEDQDEL